MGIAVKVGGRGTSCLTTEGTAAVAGACPVGVGGKSKTDGHWARGLRGRVHGGPCRILGAGVSSGLGGGRCVLLSDCLSVGTSRVALVRAATENAGHDSADSIGAILVVGLADRRVARLKIRSPASTCTFGPWLCSFFQKHRGRLRLEDIFP